MDDCSCGPSCKCESNQAEDAPLLKRNCYCVSCKCSVDTPSTYQSFPKGRGISKIVLEVEGMTCASCVATIESLTKAKKGVKDVRINLITGEAFVDFDSDIIEVEKIVQVIEDAGFEASIRQESIGSITFEIEGMTCSSCSSALEAGLLGKAGVKTVSVNLLENICTVQYDSSLIGVRDLITMIEDIGYGAQVQKNKKNRNERKEKELKNAKRKMWLGICFAVPAFMISMVFGMIPATEKYLDYEIYPGLSIESLIMFCLATPVQFWLGAKFYIGSYKSLKSFSANMDVLIAIGTSAAYFYSVAAIFMNIFLHYHTQHFFETSILLIAFVYLGKYLELYARGKTSEAMTTLLSLQAKKAILLTINDKMEIQTETEIDSELIQKGDVLKVLPGTQIPVDGTILKGSTTIDESMITGESIPIEKQIGDRVIGATINLQGQIFVLATKVGSDTTLAQIIKLVEDAQMQKAPIQALADQISQVFVPMVVLISILTFIIWFSLAETGSLPDDYISPELNEFVFALLFSIACLVIACPCALGLATPTAVMVGTGVGAKLGILIKGGQALEKAYKISAIIFDKTGTLTEGKPKVTDLILFQQNEYPFDEKTFVQIAASLEATSSHPLAQAITNFAKSKNILLHEIQNVVEIPGKGLQGECKQGTLFAGNMTWMLENQVQIENSTISSSEDIPKNSQRLQGLQAKGVSVVLFALNKILIGAVGISDTPRLEAADVVQYLEAKGLEVWMVTGDNHQTAQAVANQLQIKNVFSEVLPHQKSEKVAELQGKGHTVAMIGDGINDSPGLAKADIGISIGAGSDVAIETASIVLLKSDLWDVATAIDLSKVVFRRIKSNFIWAFGYNCVGIPLAAGVLYPLIKVHFPPFLAGLAMALSSVSVVLSSLLLKWYRPPERKVLHSSSNMKLKSGLLTETSSIN